MKLFVVLIHGIGGSDEQWAKPIIDKLQDSVLKELKNLLKAQAPSNISDVLVIQSVYWKTALEKPQAELQSILKRYFRHIVRSIRGFLRYFVSLFRWFYKLQSKIITAFIGDIVGYVEKGGKIGIEAKLNEAMNALAAASPEQDKPLTFISHSLGTVITSNYIYDRMDVHRQKAIDLMDERFFFSNMFTVGSPLALFSMRFEGPESFNRPIQVEDRDGRWINFLDKDDPIAMPLRLLNDSYKKAVNSDYPVDSGWCWGVAHTEYFTKSDTLDVIARKLAIDWIAKNNALPREAVDKHYAEFDKKVEKKIVF